VARTKRPDNPDLVAILFTDSGISYIGWQTKGALPILFGCDYFSDINKSNFIGNGKESSNRSSEKLAHTNSLGMKFVYIPPGTFMMGSPESEKGRLNDEFQHEVTLTKGFYMQTTEVTQGQWQVVMGNNPSYFKDCGDDCPVESVSWNDAQEFIEKLNQKEKGSQYRLPTEAEWEYACRAGTETRFYTGNSEADLDRAGWYSKNSGEKTHPVGRKEPNGFGLYDMHGNVWEWCQDWYGGYLTGSVIDPKGTSSGPYRVLRGGSWFDDGRLVRSAARGWLAPTFRGDFYGLRLARGQTRPAGQASGGAG
jgi:formylglycine-generating enzyme required for sulfatase activity